MLKNTKKIEVKIAPKSKSQSAVSISIIADYLHALQTIMYIAGDFLEGNKYRTGGNFPNTIKKRCDLVVNDLKYGSFEATIGLADSQTSLPFPEFPDHGTIGERALKITREIVEISADRNDIASDIFNIMPDEFRVHRCLQELDTIWPDEKSQFSLKVGFNEHKITLDPLRKPIIQQAIKKEPEKYQGKIIGRLIEIRTDRKRRCIIDTPDGEVLCNYGPELRDLMYENVDNLIAISGMIEQEKNKSSIELSEKSALQLIDSLSLTEVDFGEGNIKKFKHPLEILVDYEDESDSYIITNEEFKLLAVASNLKQGMEEINDEFKILYEEYVNEDPSNLTEGAKKLRKQLLEIIGEDS
ncbi:hypothetical protein AZH53_08920 [Methanomicrobiaceae archaeon CYW5]|uniref:hypothetical protein n=1 Tax=Methanovulcanius yangii TaxID=1789227 RepID=UPI0029CA2A89|nr:hypothetical protein [Methanovulcanius yangii]MBT8508525.1 hypothetical protein [Methanovulcanius yangii]